MKPLDRLWILVGSGSMSQEDSAAAAGLSGDSFAQVVKESVSSGEIAGAVAAVATKRMQRIEAFGSPDQASRAPMDRDTIFRRASIARTVFAAAGLVLLEGRNSPSTIPSRSGRRNLPTGRCCAPFCERWSRFNGHD